MSLSENPSIPAERKPNIIIRPARFTDYPIVRDYDVFIGDRRLDMQRGEMIIADVGQNKAVGYAVLNGRGFIDWPLVQYLCVKQQFRRQGVARNLLAHLCRQGNTQVIYLTTEDDNTPMLHMLQMLAWRHVGRIDAFNFNGQHELVFRWGNWPPEQSTIR